MTEFQALKRLVCDNVHIPSDLVVDQWTSDVEGSSTLDFLFLHDVWTTFGRLICHKITSTISTAWNFTTKFGGMCNFLIVGMWPDAAADAQVIGWVRELWGALQPFSSGSLYVNYEAEHDVG